MKIYKFIASLYIGAAIITLIVALCITSCDAQIKPLNTVEFSTSFYKEGDILTIKHTGDNKFDIISEISYTLITNLTLAQSILWLEELSAVDITPVKFLFAHEYITIYQYSNPCASIYWNSDLAYWKIPKNASIDYMNWVYSQYNNIINE